MSTQLHNASRRVHWSRASASRLDWLQRNQACWLVGWLVGQAAVGTRRVLNTRIPMRLFTLQSRTTAQFVCYQLFFTRTAERDVAVLPDDGRVAGKAPRTRPHAARVATPVTGCRHAAVREHPAVPQRVRLLQ